MEIIIGIVNIFQINPMNEVRVRSIYLENAFVLIHFFTFYHLFCLHTFINLKF
jgi:hypothetical protein